MDEWQPIETAPHEKLVLLGWWYEDTWESIVAMASHGWRRNGVSTMSRHAWATHWMPLPEPPSEIDTLCQKTETGKQGNQ